MFRKLKDNGWFCIPLIKGTKKPPFHLQDLDGFTGISENGIPDSFLEEWDDKYKLTDFGIALVLGKSSNACALDMDTADQKIINHVPDSPLWKKGRVDRIGTRLFQHNPNIASKKVFGFQDKDKDDAVEILNGNNITVIPFSLHPSGVNYKWIGDCQGLDKITPEELPHLTTHDLENIEKFYSLKYGNQYTPVNGYHLPNEVEVDGFYHSVIEGGKVRCANGSFDRIMTMIKRIVRENLTTDEKVLKLLKYDKEHHLGVCYFEDKSRSDCRADPYSNALSLIAKFQAKINQYNEKNNRPLIGVHEETPKITVSAPVVEAPTEERKTKLPPLTGMMKEFIEFVNKSDYAENTVPNLCSALAWLSMLTANRWAIKTKAYVTPANIYLWGILTSGEGKNKPQKVLKELLHKHDMIGGNSYTSSGALLMRVPNVKKKKARGGEEEFFRKGRRENLILMDECHQFFKTALGGEAFQSEMINLLNTLFSSSDGFFTGCSSLKHGADYGACSNPYFTILGYTTVDNFRKIKGNDIIGNGFFERSLVFMCEPTLKFNDTPFRDEAQFKRLQDFTDNLLGHNPVNPNSNTDTFVKPEMEIMTPVEYRFIEVTHAVETALLDFHRDRIMSKERNSFKNRFGELALKIAMLHAISDNRWEIGIADFDWGMQLVEYCFEGFSKQLGIIKDGENPCDAGLRKVVTLFKKKGAIELSRKELAQGIRFSFYSKGRLFDELIKTGFLIEENRGKSTVLRLS